jgi:hypothetical protein
VNTGTDPTTGERERELNIEEKESLEVVKELESTKKFIANPLAL